MGASGCGALLSVWFSVVWFFFFLVFKSMNTREVKPLLLCQFGLTGVPGKAPATHHQVVGYHVSRLLNPVPVVVF